MKTKRDERTVTWTMPKWAADTLSETLYMDSESSAFDQDLRDEISEALEAIKEKGPKA